MQVIFTRKVADELRDKYTVLELETFDVQGTPLETFCVVSADKIPLGELPELETLVKKHHEFLEQYLAKNYQFCKDVSEQLLGKFGGEVDSFYEEILKRINLEQESSNS